MKNPFKFGQEVTGYQFYDRKQVTKELRQKMVDGSSNVVLFAPRRYGKTSLVVRVLEELAVKDGIKGLCFDMTRVTNLGRFCEAYVNAVYAMAGGRKELMHKLTEYLASFRPELMVTVAGVVRIRLDVAAALNEMSIVEALDLPEKLAEDYRRAHALPGLSTIHTAVRGLQEAGIVDATSEGTRIADPFFARFIRSSAARVF